MSEDREPGTDVPRRGREGFGGEAPEPGASDAGGPHATDSAATGSAATGSADPLHAASDSADPPASASYPPAGPDDGGPGDPRAQGRSSWPPAALPSPFGPEGPLGPSGWTARPPAAGREALPGFVPRSEPVPPSGRDGTGAAGEPGSSPGDGGWPPASRGPGVFSLEGRPAPGLYVLAWLLAIVGLGLLVIGGSAASNTASGQHAGLAPLLFVVGGVLALALACATAAGYQVVARRSRPADRYRGPSPLYVFILVVLAVVLASAPLAATGVLQGTGSVGLVVAEAVTVLGYLAAIWLFAVRTGALSWAGMGWPTDVRVTLRRLAGDVVMGVGSVVPAYFVTVIVAAALAGVLHTTTPEVLPAPRSSVDIVAAIITAVVLAPIGEEAFFRGFALTAWWRDLGVNSALIRATLMFAAAHILNVTATSFDEGLRTALLQFVVIVPVGYVLGWLFTQRGILASIAGHMTFNSIAVILLVATSAAR